MPILPHPPAIGRNTSGASPSERGLLFRREHQVPVALALRRERGEDPAAHAKIGRAHVRTFLRAFQAQGNPRKSSASMACIYFTRICTWFEYAEYLLVLLLKARTR